MNQPHQAAQDAAQPSALGQTPPGPRSAAHGRATHETAASRRAGSTNTCGGCAATWTAANAAHCSGCHTTWSGIVMFDRHRSAAGPRGTCLEPTTVGGEFRDGMWRGPEMDEATKTARFGTAS